MLAKVRESAHRKQHIFGVSKRSTRDTGANLQQRPPGYELGNEDTTHTQAESCVSRGVCVKLGAHIYPLVYAHICIKLIHAKKDTNGEDEDNAPTAAGLHMSRCAGMVLMSRHRRGLEP